MLSQLFEKKVLMFKILTEAQRLNAIRTSLSSPRPRLASVESFPWVGEGNKEKIGMLNGEWKKEKKGHFTSIESWNQNLWDEFKQNLPTIIHLQLTISLDLTNSLARLTTRDVRDYCFPWKYRRRCHTDERNR